MRDLPVRGQALIDLIVFTAIMYMVLFRGNKNEREGARRGHWVPNIVYLPVLLFRWALVPHRDWMRGHKERNEELKSHYGHYHNHHHHHHRHHHPHGDYLYQSVH